MNFWFGFFTGGYSNRFTSFDAVFSFSICLILTFNRLASEHRDNKRSWQFHSVLSLIGADFVFFSNFIIFLYILFYKFSIRSDRKSFALLILKDYKSIQLIRTTSSWENVIDLANWWWKSIEFVASHISKYPILTTCQFDVDRLSQRYECFSFIPFIVVLFKVDWIHFRLGNAFYICNQIHRIFFTEKSIENSTWSFFPKKLFTVYVENDFRRKNTLKKYRQKEINDIVVDRCTFTFVSMTYDNFNQFGQRN